LLRSFPAHDQAFSVPDLDRGMVGMHQQKTASADTEASFTV
jgi:hypothetical protein